MSLRIGGCPEPDRRRAIERLPMNRPGYTEFSDKSYNSVDNSKNADKSVTVGNNNNSGNTTIINIGNTEGNTVGNTVDKRIGQSNQQNALGGLLGIGMALAGNLIGSFLGGQNQDGSNLDASSLIKLGELFA